MAGDPVEKPRPASYADLEAVPDHLVAEIVDGTLYTHPRPSARHARAASRIGIDLGGAFDRARTGPGGWVILDEPALHLGPDPDVLVPDLAGWRRERMPEIPDVAAFTQAPDWVCEVLSPSTEADDRAVKAPVYAREGVLHMWLLNPLLHTLEVYRLQGQAWLLVTTHRDNEQVHAEPFDAVELDLAALWEL